MRPLCFSIAFLLASASAPAWAQSFRLQLQGRLGDVAGREVSGRVEVTMRIYDATDGVHAVHFHERGDCSNPGGDFDAGPSKDTSITEHPFHLGDLPNVVISGGVGRLQHTSTRVTLSPGPRSLNDADGTSIVVHAGADGFSSSNDGGAIIACGVVYPDLTPPPPDVFFVFANYGGGPTTFNPAVMWNSSSLSCQTTCSQVGATAVGARFICNLFGNGPTEGCSAANDGQYGTANCGRWVDQGVLTTSNGNTEDCSFPNIMSCVTGSCGESVTFHALECQCSN